ncbi:ABC transporter substrate-binding protein [Nocardioides mangrovi]|uniref:ABC transporter substrate-binding protein n=1 Tax=Nocardioides mangrovi TaxID=2874580 RepID=A0ABS7UED9_9ACTN|nr:ABC transporter substrate-binding protein [Nocardioides mangrovi]MBZ5739368.1 ABC transporter substrate-binding protein [Nocardioides mangrovi]
MSLRPLALSASAVALLTALTACSGGATPGADADTPSSGSATLKVAFLGGISTPDPDTAYDGPELNLVNSAYEGLLAYKPGQADPELEGVLATDWSANDDNTVFTFTLRDGVTFHDGTPFTSAAVAASFQRRTDVGEGPSYMVAGVKKVATPSDDEVVITLKYPNSSFLALLASPFGPKMISPTALKEHPVSDQGTDWFDSHDAGTGPYTYGDFHEGVSYELDAYDDYWGTKPGYSEIDFPVVADMSTVQLQMKSGDLDAVIGYADDTTYDDFTQDSDLATYAFSSMQTPTMFVNPQSAALGDDATRKAFVSGIDFADLATSSLGSTAEPTTEVFPKNLLPSDVDQQVIQYDSGALASLADGALSGKTITIGYPASSPSGKSLSDHLAATLNGAGIDAKSVSFGSGTYYSALAKGADAPDITFFSGFPDTAHPDSWGYVFYTPDGGLDLFGAEVPEATKLLGEAVEDDDIAKYGQAAELVSESAYWYSVATSLGTVVTQKDVGGVEDSWNPVITGVLDLDLLHPES